MADGVIKWFNQAKGFGFLVKSDGSGDCFVHAQDFKKCNIDETTVDEGHKFSFDVASTPRGIKATNLIRIPD